MPDNNEDWPSFTNLDEDTSLQQPPKKRKIPKRSSAYYSEIGRRGGKARARNAKKKKK